MHSHVLKSQMMPKKAQTIKILLSFFPATSRNNHFLLVASSDIYILISYCVFAVWILDIMCFLLY